MVLKLPGTGGDGWKTLCVHVDDVFRLLILENSFIIIQIRPISSESMRCRGVAMMVTRHSWKRSGGSGVMSTHAAFEV